jgi:hypothetical protein
MGKVFLIAYCNRLILENNLEQDILRHEEKYKSDNITSN